MQSSWGLPPSYPAVVLCHEILELWIGRTGPFICPNHLLRIQIWGRAWVAAELTCALALPYTPPGPAPLCCPGVMLSQVLRPVRGRTSPPGDHRWQRAPLHAVSQQMSDRDSSPVPLPSGLAHQCLLGQGQHCCIAQASEVQGPFSRGLPQVRSRDSPLALMTLGLAFLTACLRWQGARGRRAFPCSPPSLPTHGSGVMGLALLSWHHGLAHSCLRHQGQPYCAAKGEEQGQLS